MLTRKVVVLSSLVATLLAITILPSAQRTTYADGSPFPTPTGPYKLGTVIRDWTDPSRSEVIASNPSDKRELLVQFWYPADSAVATNGKLAPYMAASDTTLTNFESEISDSRGISLSLPRDQFAALTTHAVLNAPVANNAQVYPVLIFSPGFAASPDMYTVQVEELASHGYIVVTINYPYGSGVTAFPDGRVLLMPPGVSNSKSLLVWAQDQAFVINQLQAINSNDPDKLFTGRLDVNHIGAFGHSVGAGAVIKLCSTDNRVAACLSEDSPALGQLVTTPLTQPFFLIESENNAGANDPIYQTAKGKTYSAVFRGFEHDNFADFSLWPGIGPLAADPTALGKIDPARSFKILDTYAIAFFDKFLKGQTTTLLDGASTAYPEVQFQSRN